MARTVCMTGDAAPDKNSTLAPRHAETPEREGGSRRPTTSRKQDEILYRRATEGVRDQETLGTRFSRWGGDATRSSPVQRSKSCRMQNPA